MPTTDLSERRARPRGRRFAVIAVLVLIVVLIAAEAVHDLDASTASSSLCVSGVTINGAGSDLDAPLLNAWGGGFGAATVNYQSTGEETGIQDLQALAVQFSEDDGPIWPVLSTEFVQPPLTMPVAEDPIVVVYNLHQVKAPLRVNGSWLAEVFEGSIKNWDDPMLQSLNPGVTLPNESISVIVRLDPSGTSLAFQEYLAQQSHAWAVDYGSAETWVGPEDFANLSAVSGGPTALGTVVSTPGAISYSDLDYALSNQAQVAEVQNPAGSFVSPTVSDTYSAVEDLSNDSRLSLPNATGNWAGVDLDDAPGATDYPIVTFTTFSFYAHPQVLWLDKISESTVAWFVAFLNWVVTKGQDMASTVAFAPLPGSISAGDTATVDQVLWNGKAVPACA